MPGVERLGVVSLGGLELDKREALNADQKELLSNYSRPDKDSSAESVKEKGLPGLFLMDPNITMDPSAPRLYSRFSIRFFTILFSTLFGGILLAINFYRLGKKREIIPLTGFAILYTYLSYYLMMQVELDMTTLALVFNLIGSLVLEELFWKRYIGKKVKFRRQSLWQALLVAVLLVVFVLSGLGGGMGM